MPAASDTVTTPAPPEEVWKILHDPYRLPDWWADLVGLDLAPAGTPEADLEVFYADEPDVPRPQRHDSSPSGHRIVMSCLTTDIRFTWTLEPLDGGGATRITVLMEVPADQAHLLESQRSRLAQSLSRLAALAAGAY